MTNRGIPKLRNKEHTRAYIVPWLVRHKQTETLEKNTFLETRDDPKRKIADSFNNRERERERGRGYQTWNRLVIVSIGADLSNPTS
jgi:hypothetical protein